MTFDVVKCGACVGCELECDRDKLLKQLDDELFMPRLRALADRYDPPGSQIKPDPRSYESRAIMRERAALLEYRSRIIWDIVKRYSAGCCRPIIRTSAVEARAAE